MVAGAVVDVDGVIVVVLVALVAVRVAIRIVSIVVILLVVPPTVATDPERSDETSHMCS